MYHKKLEIAAALLILITIAVGYSHVRGMVVGTNLEELWAALAARETLDTATHIAMVWLEVVIGSLLITKILKDLLKRKREN